MARIKVCPKCNHRNPSTQSQCICGESLFNIRAVSEDVYEKQLAQEREKSLSREELQSHADENNNASSKENLTGNTDSSPAINRAPTSTEEHNHSIGILIKICPDCGAENRGVAKICQNCGTNIKQIKAEFRTVVSRNTGGGSIAVADEETVIGRLSSPDGSYSFTVDAMHPIFQIGREASMAEYLDEHMFTSRIHAEIAVIGSKLAIKDLGKQNGTFVNNRRLPPLTLTLLEGGDKVSLGGKWEEDWKNSQSGCFIVYYDDCQDCY